MITLVKDQIIVLKVSQELEAEFRLVKWIDQYYDGYKGYLLQENEEDRIKDIFTLFLFPFSKVSIMINDYSHIIEYSTKYHIKLNSHATFEQVTFGFNNDDFVTKKMSGRLSFTF